VFAPRKPHVGELVLLAGESLLHVQIETDESKRERDVPGVLVGVLRRECINYVLMNERRLGVREGVGAQLSYA
jgi:hypothetical protein